MGADGSEIGVTWGELDRRSSQLAMALADKGLRQGGRLGIGLRNSPQFMFSLLAAWKLGAVPIPLRWDLPAWELARLKAVIDATVDLGEDDLDWIEETAHGAVAELPDVVSPHINGMCSGGSTGLPKVILSNRPGLVYGLLNAPLVESVGLRVSRPQRICILGPLYHANGFGPVFQFLGGDELVVLEKFDAALLVDVIERHRVTGFQATPTMLKRIVELPGIERRDLSSLEYILQGAAPMPGYIVRRLCELIAPERVIMAYGMSEGLGLVAINGVEWLEHEGSVGRPLRGTEVRVLDPEGRAVPPGTAGDVFLRSGSYAGSSYLGDVPSMPVTDDGFYSVGDIGYLDEDGYLYLLDRRADLIITGGANVYPAEVESALIDHPKIADVVVIGLKDPEWGRRVHAVVVAKDGSDPPTFEEIRAYAKSRLAVYKAPHTMEIVDALPRSEATKINRSALIEARGG